MEAISRHRSGAGEMPRSTGEQMNLSTVKFISATVRRWRIVLVVLLAASALLYLTLSRGTSSTTDVKADTSAPQQKTVHAQVVMAEAQDVSKYIEATGTFQAYESTDVAAEVSGKVARTLVNEGDFVSAGTVIVQLDAEDAALRLRQARDAEAQARAQVAQAEAQLRQAQANIGLDQGGKFSAENIPAVRQARAALASRQSDLTLAETTEKRYTLLLESGDTSREFFEQKRNETAKARAAVNEAQEALRAAENAARQSNQGIEANRANVQSAQAALQSAQTATALAEKTVADTAIRAPFAGYISARPVAAGEYVSPQTSVATIVRTNPIKVRLQVPETEAANMSVGMSVSASVAAYPDRTFGGKISALNPVLNESARSLQVDVIFENVDTLLRPGMFATARVQQPGGERGVFVPRTAVVNETNTNSLGVYIVDQGGTARLRTVQIDESTRENNRVRILSGVNEGEQVAATNTEELFDGAKIAAEYGVVSGRFDGERLTTG